MLQVLKRSLRAMLWSLPRKIFALATYALPNFRGLGRLYRYANNFFNSMGAPPVALARMRDGTTLLVDLRSLIEVQAYYRGEYDTELLFACKQLYDTSTYFIDVGANVGFYSVAISQYIRSTNSSGRVIAFEPHPANFARLNENLELNNLYSICDCFQLGLSDCAGRLTLVMREDFVRGSETGNASIATTPDFDEGFNSVEVDVATLDAYLHDRFKGVSVGFIKVDIEGHEDFFLAGAIEPLAKHRPLILLEVNKPFYKARGVDVDDVLLPKIPERYAICRFRNQAMHQISLLEACSNLDNVFLIPTEKLDSLKDSCNGISWN